MSDLKILEDLIEDYKNKVIINDVQAEALQMLTDIKKHPSVREVDIKFDTNTACLNVYTHPISLKNPYGDGSLPLGCMIIKLYSDHGFEIHRDTSIPDSESGRSEYLYDDIHPHVNNGHVCTGSAGDIIYKISKSNDIPMFITFIIEFLKTYNRGNPYWSPWFKEPCVECGKLGTDACKWCVCTNCSAKRRNNLCGGCARWMKQSAGVAAQSISKDINNIVNNMDEDEFIILAKAISEMLKK